MRIVGDATLNVRFCSENPENPDQNPQRPIACIFLTHFKQQNILFFLLMLFQGRCPAGVSVVLTLLCFPLRALCGQ